MESTPVFTLDNVSYHVGDTQILTDISFQIPSGEHWALMGPSGAGKSTLLRLFNGLISPTEGILRYNGELLDSMDFSVLRRKAGMLFQEAVMINGTVRENLTLPKRWIRGEQDFSDERLSHFLEQVGLEPKVLELSVRSLSGGEKQRIALARVLLNEPDVLLLDEPTANLDPPLARKILKLITRLQKELNLTIIRVSHHPDLVRNIADHVVFLNGGRVIETGPVSLLNTSDNPTICEFLEESQA